MANDELYGLLKDGDDVKGASSSRADDVEALPGGFDDSDLCVFTCCKQKMAFDRKQVSCYMIWGLIFAALGGTIAISIDYTISGKQEKHVVAWYSAGVFVMLAVPISLYEIFMHLAHYYAPELQRFVVRVLWMVPIYAVESWFSLRFKSQAVYLETARECYEAYVIYNFLYFLIAYLGGEEKIIADSLARNAPDKEHHIWPMHYCLKQWRTGKQFLVRCKLGALQYVVIKLVLSIVTFICESTGTWDEGNLSPHGAYLYVAFVGNCSQIWAMYCLVLFYHAFVDELEAIRPLPKFICVKAVVFFSFWQQVAIAVLVKEGVIHSTFDYTTDQIARGLQDYLICIEMFFASMAHMYSFSHKDFLALKPANAPKRNLRQAFFDSALPGEVIEDTVRMGKGVTRAIGKTGKEVRKGFGRAVNELGTGFKKVFRRKKKGAGGVGVGVGGEVGFNEADDDFIEVGLSTKAERDEADGKESLGGPTDGLSADGDGKEAAEPDMMLETEEASDQGEEISIGGKADVQTGKAAAGSSGNDGPPSPTPDPPMANKDSIPLVEQKSVPDSSALG